MMRRNSRHNGRRWSKPCSGVFRERSPKHRAGIFHRTNTKIEDKPASHNEPYVGKNYTDETMKSPNEEHPFTFDELYRVIEGDEQVGFETPDSKYAYSDTGYTILLAYIIERVSGKSYEAFVRNTLLIPNGL